MAHGVERQRRRYCTIRFSLTTPCAARQQREYFALGKDFLERGIKNNPDRPQLYESLARLYKEKLHNHAAAAKLFAQRCRLAVRAGV